MKPFDILNISGSALAAERRRAEVIAANLANAETTRTDAGGPFHRREVVFQSASPFRMLLANSSSFSQPGGTVRITDVRDDPSDPILRYEPGHPDANKDGYVAYPNINPAKEMVDLMGAVRSYQLNASAIAASKQMIQQSISILNS